MGCGSSKRDREQVSSGTQPLPVIPSDSIRQGKEVFDGLLVTVKEATWTTAQHGDIKAIVKSFRQGTDFENAEKEALTMNRLSHDHVVHAYGIMKTEDQFAIVMEKLDLSLEQYLRTSKPLSDQMAIKISLQAADALKYISSKGIVHNDIATRNILINRYNDGDVSAKVADFGQFSNRTDTTPADFASDVLQFGGVLQGILKNVDETGRQRLQQVGTLAGECQNPLVDRRPTWDMLFVQLKQLYEAIWQRPYSSCSCPRSCIRHLLGDEKVNFVFVSVQKEEGRQVLEATHLGTVSTATEDQEEIERVTWHNIDLSAFCIGNTDRMVASVKKMANVRGLVCIVDHKKDLKKMGDLVQKLAKAGYQQTKMLFVIKGGESTEATDENVKKRICVDKFRNHRIIKTSFPACNGLYDGFCWLST